MTKQEIEKEIDEELESYWLPLLKTKGMWDEQKIKNELHDLLFIYKQVAETYEYITGGQLSKAMYYADVIKTKYDDEVNDSYLNGKRDCEENHE